MQIATEMPPHRQPRLLSPLCHPLPRLRLCLPTSSPMVAAITLWLVITFLAGSSFLDPQRPHPLQALLTSFGTSIPFPPGLVYQKNFPAMVVQNSLQGVQRLSSISGEYDIMRPRPTSLSPAAEQRSQVSQAPSYVQH